MTPRENIISIFRRTGMEYAPVCFNLCPSQMEEFHRRYGEGANPADCFGFPWRGIRPEPPVYDPETTGGGDSSRGDWRFLYPGGVKEGTSFDIWGVAHEPGSKEAMHMTKLVYPMKSYDSLEQFQAYPYPYFADNPSPAMVDQVREYHRCGLAAMGHLGQTIWERAWIMRGMEELMVEMMTDDPIAVYHLDRITDQACRRASAFARAGADLIHLGDDVGMQRSLMMSGEMYRTWLKPRLTRVVETIRSVRRDILITYHSCGFIKPLIPDLIEAGIDVLNPVQPECMDFKEIHDEYGDRLTFWGTLGTQSTLPFGTPEEVRETVFRNLDIAGPRGGLLCAPTHLVEPEVPWENIEAYVRACGDYGS